MSASGRCRSWTTGSWSGWSAGVTRCAWSPTASSPPTTCAAAAVCRDGGSAVRAWVVARPGPADGVPGPLERVDAPEPGPGPGEVAVRVRACGVCRTDLHLAEGDLAPRRPRTVPGHEVVGVVDALGPGAGRFVVGERIGVPWLRGTCGRCRWCRTGRENLCPSALFTG